MKTKAVKDDRWTRPGKMTQEEFLKGISEAENGAFSTFEEHKKHMTIWFETNILKKQ